ncbi:hypothetical protein ElyMa_000391600 [Elysia marginata]|uniref:RNase H type-1 domain-containing protein n=1 Tax=Elysia marginata TaxID=1093978 RepID=A0AAV4FI35_9GAST|nr:hypothetical protein ElyMa_000391600 [Elysia marginata]
MVSMDGSASEAVRDGGGGVYIEWPDNSSSKISIPTGKYSTNYKAEAEALQEAAKVLVNSEATHHSKVVLLTDARSVLDALDSTKCPEVNALWQRSPAGNHCGVHLCLPQTSPSDLP